MIVIIKNYYHDVSLIILMYDISYSSSFYNLESWVKDIKLNIGKKDIPIFLVGNKSDLKDNSNIKIKDVLNFSRKYKMELFEISVKNNKDVNQLFDKVIDRIFLCL